MQKDLYLKYSVSSSFFKTRRRIPLHFQYIYYPISFNQFLFLSIRIERLPTIMIAEIFTLLITLRLSDIVYLIATYFCYHRILTS
jgi:hypothetical protein